MNDYMNIIVDTNDLYHRSYGILFKDSVSTKDLINESVKLTMKQIVNIKNTYLAENGTMWILADNPTSKKVIRKQLDPDYKSFRMKESDNFYRGIDIVLLICNYYSDNMNTVRIKTMEADDLVKPLVESFNKYDKNLLVSVDLDWSRCMNENTDWLSKKVLYTQETFREKYKFIPNERTVTLYKSLLGDTSDNIPSIQGINEQTALNIIHEFNDVFDLIDSIKYKKKSSEILSDFVKLRIIENKDRLILNHQLVYFSFISDSEIKQAIIKGRYNSKSLNVLYKSLGFEKDFDSRNSTDYSTFDSLFNFEEIRRK